MMVVLEEEDVKNVLSKTVEGLDEDIITYLAGMVSEEADQIDSLAMSKFSEVNADTSPIYESISPFLESYGYEKEIILQASIALHDLFNEKSGHHIDNSISRITSSSTNSASSTLKQGKKVSMASLEIQSEAEASNNRFLWGTDTGILAVTNKQRDAHTDTVSSKDKRKQRHELERERKVYEQKMRAMEAEEKKEGNSVVSTMVLPDYNSGRNEKDIHVRNVGLSLDSGRILLDNGELKFTHRRRYGLVRCFLLKARLLIF